MLISFARDDIAPLAGGGSRRIAAGTEVDLDPAKAQKLVVAGIAAAVAPARQTETPLPPEDPASLPRLGPAGELIIPINAPARFRWWQGGQEPSETLRELYEERAAIMEFDGGLPRHEAERQAAELTGHKPTLERKNTDDLPD